MRADSVINILLCSSLCWGDWVCVQNQITGHRVASLGNLQSVLGVDVVLVSSVVSCYWVTRQNQRTGHRATGQLQTSCQLVLNRRSHTLQVVNFSGGCQDSIHPHVLVGAQVKVSARLVG